MTYTQQTALLPIDPAVSPQQISRIVPIRANLLPTEVTSHRNARHTRILLVGAAVLVAVLLGLWYLYAVGQKATAADERDTANAQKEAATKSLDKYKALISTLDQQKVISGQIKQLVATDLPWAGTLDTLRSTGTRVGATVTTISATPASAETAKADSTAVAALAIGGTAPDKKTVAEYVDALAKLTGITDVYLGVASQEKKQVTFSLTAVLTTEALCGRFTEPCPTGGN